VTSTEEYTEWRSVLVAAGFDENGDPYYRTEQQPYTTTRSVSATCNACGGSGRGGACDRCGGSGEVTCSECGGRGEVACSRCGGSGRVACGTCGGSGTIVCPYCRGAPLDCPLCGGTRTLLPKGAP
jgi:DnaJ-class molecular chaperone